MLEASSGAFSSLFSCHFHLVLHQESTVLPLSVQLSCCFGYPGCFNGKPESPCVSKDNVGAVEILIEGGAKLAAFRDRVIRGYKTWQEELRAKRRIVTGAGDSRDGGGKKDTTGWQGPSRRNSRGRSSAAQSETLRPLQAVWYTILDAGRSLLYTRLSGLQDEHSLCRTQKRAFSPCGSQAEIPRGAQTPPCRIGLRQEKVRQGICISRPSGEWPCHSALLGPRSRSEGRENAAACSETAKDRHGDQRNRRGHEENPKDA
jgi:hypothetical protein